MYVCMCVQCGSQGQFVGVGSSSTMRVWGIKLRFGESETNQAW